MARVLSTYRLQMRADLFTFADAEKTLDYVAALGVSHIYLSPILTATRGSTHGYDVTDPTTVSAELGGPDGLAALSAAARQRGLGIIVDIVPNHLGVADARQNAWWWDLLRAGRESLYARYFDIDWAADPDGRIVLPVLGSDEDVAGLAVDDSGPEPVLRLGDLVFPVAPGTGAGTGAEVHGRQHYRLIGWRNKLCGYRRFFSITSLAGIRQEDREVFDATHAEIGRWFAAGLVDGLRIDHPDGLTDPSVYLQWLRELTGPDAYIVIEKILDADEALEPTLPVEGTTGYDALREIGGVLVDPAGQAVLTDLYDSAGGNYAAMPRTAAELKKAVATDTLASEMRRLCTAVVATAGQDHPALPEAIAEVLSRLGVYRSDYLSLTSVLPAVFAETIGSAPHLAAPLRVLSAALAPAGEAAVRLQQVCGAMTAKALEDCLFYRDARLVSLNEVGGEPQRFGVDLAEFHLRAAIRGLLWPAAMTTLTTHDTKRGEDVRARIGVLSQVADRWSDFVNTAERRHPSPDRATTLFLWQNIFGVWPADGTVTAELRARLRSYTEKAMREAGTRTSWNEPDSDFEAAVHTWVEGVLDTAVADELTALVTDLLPHAQSDALAQKLLALTVPGVPDVYQGTELWEDSLVDPDNRRAVDFAIRADELATLAHPKMRVVHAALHARREHPETFGNGGYTPISGRGSAAAHLVAFLRGDDVLVAVPRCTVRLAEMGWGETVLPLPSGIWTDRLGDATFTGTARAADLFAGFGVALLVRADA